MAYIGNQLTSNAFVVDQFSGTGGQTVYSPLTFAPASTAAIAVYINGVYQSPTSAYSLSGKTITFTTAPSGGTNNILILHLGTGATAGVPSDTSVTLTKLASETYNYINVAYSLANTSGMNAASASSYANSAFLHANAAFISSNTKAPTAAPTFSGNLTLTGSTSGFAYIQPPAIAGGAQLTLPNTSSTLGYLNIPAVGQKTDVYTLSTLDVGKFVEQSNANGTITVPTSTFSSGDAVSVFNNTNTSLVISCSGLTAFTPGNNATKTSVNVSTRGVASILFINSSVCVITGSLSGA
jgi:hypothetical protein